MNSFSFLTEVGRSADIMLVVVIVITISTMLWVVSERFISFSYLTLNLMMCYRLHFLNSGVWRRLPIIFYVFWACHSQCGVMWGGHKGKPWGLGDFGKRGGDRGGSIKYYCIIKCTGMRHKSILGLHSGDLFRIPGLIGLPSILCYVLNYYNPRHLQFSNPQPPPVFKPDWRFWSTNARFWTTTIN